MTPNHSPELIDQLFDAFRRADDEVGGMTRLAEALDTPVQTVHSWKQNGVPRWRRAPIVRKAVELGIALPDSILDYLDPDRAATNEATAPSAESLAAEGIARSAEHAEAVREGWGDDAYGYLERYVAVTPDEFLGEELKRWAYDNGLDEPVNESAWGSVIRRASRAKLIEFVGFAKSKNASRHGTPGRLWRRR